MDAIVVNYRMVDYGCRPGFNSGKTFYIFDRDTVRHLAYDRVARPTLACYLVHGEYSVIRNFVTP